MTSALVAAWGYLLPSRQLIFEVRREAPALLWKRHRKILAAQEIPRVRLCVCPQPYLGNYVSPEVN